MAPKLILGAPTRAQRAAHRQALGLLRDRRIGQATFSRYVYAAGLFHMFVLTHFGHLAESFPARKVCHVGFWLVE